jgi:four helix bundle protein
MSGADDFTRLVIWRKSQDLAAEIVALVAQLPRNRAADIIGSQLLRAAGSVPANVAEGYGRFSQPAYRNHLSIARGSLFETQSWLDLLHRSGFLEDPLRMKLIAACSEIGRLLTLRMKELGTGSKTYAVREEGEGYHVDD